jgi:hypothetical protein
MIDPDASTHRDLALRPPRMRFTIRGLMLAIAITAGLLALPKDWREVGAVLSIPVASLVAAWWLVRRGRCRLAAICFWAPACITNSYIAAESVTPEGWPTITRILVSLFVLLPTLLAMGVAWACLATRKTPAVRGMPWVVGLSVIVLSVMPATTSMSLWPCRLAFLATRPRLERLAKRVSAGHAITYPQWVGPFRVNGSNVDPATKNVALLTDTDPSCPAGFIRDTVGNCWGTTVRGDALHLDLGPGWCYHVED